MQNCKKMYFLTVSRLLHWSTLMYSSNEFVSDEIYLLLQKYLCNAVPNW